MKKSNYFSLFNRIFCSYVVFSFFCSFVFADETFHANFEQGLDGRNAKDEQVSSMTIATLTEEGFGQPGKAAIIALENLSDFQSFAPKEEIYPIGNLKYEATSVGCASNFL